MGYLKWVQNPIVTLVIQTGVNVIWAHIPLQKGVQNGVPNPLFWAHLRAQMAKEYYLISSLSM